MFLGRQVELHGYDITKLAKFGLLEDRVGLLCVFLTYLHRPTLRSGQKKFKNFTKKLTFFSHLMCVDKNLKVRKVLKYHKRFY